MFIWQGFGRLATPIHLGTDRDVFRAQPLVSFFIRLGPCRVTWTAQRSRPVARRAWHLHRTLRSKQFLDWVRKCAIGMVPCCIPTPVHLGADRDVFRARHLVSFFISFGLVAFHALHNGAGQLRLRRGTCIVRCAASDVRICSASASLTGCCRAAQYSRQSHAAG